MKKIILIDDNAELLASLGRIFKNITFEECHSATEAIVAIMVNNPEVLLLDHQLSDEGNEGYEVVEYIRKNNLNIKIYSTTKNDSARAEYEKMGIGWINKNDLVELKNLVKNEEI